MLFLVAAILCFVLAAISSHDGSEILVSAAVWGFVGLACFAAAHLPWAQWRGQA